jgi:transcription initiation factor TFIIIB Brf1 subunit/transcription initiation factor TFIIB
MSFVELDFDSKQLDAILDLVRQEEQDLSITNEDIDKYSFVDGSENNDNKSEINKNWGLCDRCNIPTIKENNETICPECHQIKHVIEDNISYHNSSQYMPVADKAMDKRARSVQYLTNINEKNNNTIPRDIISDVADMYMKISEHNTHRSSVLRIIHAQLVKYKMEEKGLTKTDNELIDMFNITTSSVGNSIIRKYVNDGLIIVPNLDKDFTISYYKQMAQKLNIEGTDELAEEIYERAKSKQIDANHIELTRAVGLIMFITEIKNIRITMDNIQKVSRLSYPTIKEYFQTLYKNIRIFKKIFKKYNIEVPTKYLDFFKKKI